MQVSSRELFALQVLESVRVQASLYRALKWALRVLRHPHEPASRGLDLGERRIRLVERGGPQSQQVRGRPHLNALANEVRTGDSDGRSIVNDMLRGSDVVLVQDLLHLLVVLLLELVLQGGKDLAELSLDPVEALLQLLAGGVVLRRAALHDVLDLAVDVVSLLVKLLDGHVWLGLVEDEGENFVALERDKVLQGLGRSDGVLSEPLGEHDLLPFKLLLKADLQLVDVILVLLFELPVLLQLGAIARPRRAG